RRGAGGHIEILGRQVQEQVAYAAAYYISLVAGLLQAFDHIDRIAADARACQRVLATAEHFRGGARMRGAAQGKTKRLERLLQHGTATVLRIRRGSQKGNNHRMAEDSSTGRGDGERIGLRKGN